MPANKKVTTLVALGIDGDRLYQLRARQALPILIRYALAGENLKYYQLAEELGMPNPRNLNFVLGSIGTTLHNLGGEWGENIPAIQSLVVSKNSGLPGIGFFQGFADRRPQTKQQREAFLKREYAHIWAYPGWLRVLSALNLEKADTKTTSTVIEKARQGGGGGEGREHRELKERIYNNPRVIGLRFKPTFRMSEFPLPSGDRIDVYLEHEHLQVAVEVKASTSSEEDITRGLFQCVKYEAILNKWRASQTVQADVRVVLALGKPFPESLKSLRNLLQVEVIDKL